MPGAQLVAEYQAGAAQLRAAVAGLSAADARLRPIPGKWSTLEVVCHLADFELVFADRMRRTIALETPTLLGADENAFAARLHYHDRDLDEEIALIEAVRTATGRLLRALPELAFQRPAVHSERGPITLELIVQGAVRHIAHHLPFIAAKRAALRAE